MYEHKQEGIYTYVYIHLCICISVRRCMYVNVFYVYLYIHAVVAAHAWELRDTARAAKPDLSRSYAALRTRMRLSWAPYLPWGSK